MHKLKDLSGQKFGKLTIISYHGIINRKSHWNCICDCGITCVKNGNSLKFGHIKSCGCLRGAHGESNKNKTKEYSSWLHAKGRCTNHKNKNWPDYGGRGIKFHKPWAASYKLFLEYVGRSPSATHSLDRINNNGNYEPGNVRWATPKEQANNQRKRNRFKMPDPGLFEFVCLA